MKCLLLCLGCNRELQQSSTGEVLASCVKGFSKKSATHTSLPLGGGIPQGRLSLVFRTDLWRKHLSAMRIFSFKLREAVVTCFLCSPWPRLSVRGWDGWRHSKSCDAAFSTHKGLPKQVVGETPLQVGKLWEVDSTETETSVAILHFPELVSLFCVIQNDGNWEYVWNKQALWLSNMSASLFMFICRLCNSYKL